MSRQSTPSLPAPRNGHAAFVADTEQRRERIREHLEQILSSSVFRNSKRYAAVLRYVVERTLEGNTDQLKERSIGMDVFGRESNYDTAADHVVRSAAAEIRKRLAQYYLEDGSEAEIRIELQPGSYVPVFRSTTEAPIAEEPVVLATSAARGAVNRRWLIAAGAVIGGLAVTVSLSAFRTSGSGSDAIAKFWKPVLSSPAPVLLCIGNVEGGRRLAGNESDGADLPALTVRQFHRSPSQLVQISDAITLTKFAALLHGNRKPYRIATQSEADFADLQGGPAILIGLLNNDWTDRLVGKLRFTAERPGPGKFVIRDNANPARTEWSMDYLTPVPEITKDYAIVLRVVDPKTDQVVVTAGGIAVFGTLAAGEFLTSARELSQLEAIAPKDWEHKNAEIVLSTDVIRGKSGRPKIVAAHFW